MSQHPVGYLIRFKSQVDDAEQLFPGESHDHLWSYTHGTKKMEHFAAFPDMEVVPLYAAPQATPPAQSAPPAAAEQSEPAKPAFTKTRSIIHDCPAIKLPQTFLQRLGNTAQLVVLKGADDDLADALIAMLNAPPAAPAPAPAPVNQELLAALQGVCAAMYLDEDTGQFRMYRSFDNTAMCDALGRAESGAPAPAPQPLTDHQIEDAAWDHGLNTYKQAAFFDGVRFAEKRHGITGGATGEAA